MDIPKQKKKKPLNLKRQKIAKFFFSFQRGHSTSLHELGVFQKLLSHTEENIVKVNGFLDQKTY